jgi:salicylate 5-hydroxylase small subunit
LAQSDGGLIMVDIQTWLSVQQLHADYASAVDSGHWNLWPEFFTEECVYKLQSRENHERGFPLATLFFTSKGMLKDRVYGITETLYHDPYYQRHVVGAPVIRKLDEGKIYSEANYAVFRTKFDKESTVFNVGRYLDTIVQTPEGFKFAERLCIFDSEMIPNSIIYPI